MIAQRSTLIQGVMLLAAMTFALLATAFKTHAAALEIRLAPDDRVYIAHEQRTFGIGNVAVQNAAIVNASGDAMTIEEVTFTIWSGGEMIACQRHAGDRFNTDWAGLARYLSRPEARKVEDARYRFRQLLGDKITLSPTTTLAPGTAMYSSRRFLMLYAAMQFVDGRPNFTWPELLRITVRATTATGKSVRAETELRIVDYQPKNEYHFPVSGRWYIASSSSVRSHHRYLPVHEFALDVIQIDAGGSHANDGAKHADYYAYGKGVHAIGNGMVVVANDGSPDTRLRRKDESVDAYRKAVFEPLTEQGYLAIGGNLVVIEHPGGEFSSYAHLRPGSIRVKKGDVVTRDQVIAEVGLSGDGYQPHLHFQLTDSADMSYGRGIPLIFTNVKPVLLSSTLDINGRRQLQTGEFVETVE